jgi:hypothetical protein
MDYTRYVLALVVLTVVGFLGDQIRKKMPGGDEKEKDEYETVKQYLLNQSPLYGYNRPKLWIHSKYEYNSRKWKSFYSRSSYDLNQPYIYLTIKSIINHCGDDFNICLIDDDSFEKLIPNWDIKLSKVIDPMKSHLREVGMAQLVYYYGGMVLPNSFVCSRNLIDMYHEGIGRDGNRMFVCERPNRFDDFNHKVSHRKFVPDSYIMGAAKNCPQMKEYVEYLKTVFNVGDTRLLAPLPSMDRTTVGMRTGETASGVPDLDGPRGADTVQAFYTHETEFTGEIASWLWGRVQKGEIAMLDGGLVGVKSRQKEVIDLDQLMADGYLDVDNDSIYGIWIPRDDLLIRTKYSWFAVMPTNQVLDSHTIVAKYLKLSMIDSADEYRRKSSIQPSVVSL